MVLEQTLEPHYIYYTIFDINLNSLIVINNIYIQLYWVEVLCIVLLVEINLYGDHQSLCSANGTLYYDEINFIIMFSVVFEFDVWASNNRPQTFTIYILILN